MTIKRQWTLATALVCLLVLVAGFLLLVKPQHSKASSVKTQTTAVQSQVTQLRAQLATLVEESKTLTAKQATLAAIEQQLPSTPQLPDLLTKLDAAASKDVVDLQNVAPGNPTAYSFSAVPTATPSTGVSTAPTTTTVTPVSGLAVIPVVLTVTGGYPQMESFISDLEGLRRSMLVNSFTLTYKGPTTTSKTSSAPTLGALGDISATINTQVFMSTAPLGSTTATPSASASS